MALGFSSRQLKTIIETTPGKTYAVFGVTVLAVISLVFFAIRPAWISITNKISENNIKRVYINNIDEQMNRLVNLSSISERYSVGIAYLKEYFKEEPKESFMLINLLNLAVQKNVSLDYLKVERAEFVDADMVITNDIVSQKKVVIKVSGELTGLETFLQGLESLPKPVNISTVSYYSREVEDINTKPWEMTIECYIYFWDINEVRLKTNA